MNGSTYALGLCWLQRSCTVQGGLLLCLYTSKIQMLTAAVAQDLHHMLARTTLLELRRGVIQRVALLYRATLG